MKTQVELLEMIIDQAEVALGLLSYGAHISIGEQSGRIADASSMLYALTRSADAVKLRRANTLAAWRTNEDRD